LRDALASIEGQSYSNFEVLVVDDGSTHPPRNLNDEFNFERFQLICHEENRGASAARNTGLSRANGGYIAFLDSDDRWLDDKISKQVERLEGNSNVGMVYCWTRLRNPTVKNKGIRPTARGDVYQRQLARDVLAGTPTWLVRSDSFETVGGFNEELTARNDYEMSLRLAEFYEVDYVPEELVEVGESTSDERLSERHDARIRSHLEIIDSVVKPRLKTFSFLKRRKILSTQYFTLARDCQQWGFHDRAVMFFQRSLRWNPFSPKILGACLFAYCGRDLPEFYYRWMS
jgi:glycosyltransferase involved in cell wall biosynthesis